MFKPLFQIAYVAMKDWAWKYTETKNRELDSSVHLQIWKYVPIYQ